MDHMIHCKAEDSIVHYLIQTWRKGKLKETHAQTDKCIKYPAFELFIRNKNKAFWKS
jgi:hypothetical protein